DGRLVSVTVKPKVFKKLEQAQAEYPMWVAAIAGKMGQTSENGFVLVEPNIQVFEKKPKEPKETLGTE
ncbi:fertility inhibition FinO-like protein, partial [Trichocoleus sp. ST-U2]|nr:fertility inhibition FinO-like protein [Coleofasciculus sp. FACHB-SPT9]